MRTRSVLLVLAVAVLAAACAPGANPLVGEGLVDASPAGFLFGVWHGFIIMFTFVISLFSDAVSMYEVHNTGWPYNLGFLFGAMSFFGGGGGAAGSKRKR